MSVSRPDVWIRFKCFLDVFSVTLGFGTSQYFIQGWWPHEFHIAFHWGLWTILRSYGLWFQHEFFAYSWQLLLILLLSRIIVGELMHVVQSYCQSNLALEHADTNQESLSSIERCFGFHSRQDKGDIIHVLSEKLSILHCLLSTWP